MELVQEPQKEARLVILRYKSAYGDGPSENPADWELVRPADVPKEVKNPTVIGVLMSGDICRVKGGQWWYRAELVEASNAGA